MCTHTYIHNWPLQAFSQDYGLASHTTHVVCVNFIGEWWYLQFNVDTEQHICEKLFSWHFYFTLRVFARNLLRGNRRRSIFHTSFLITDLGYETRLLLLIRRHTATLIYFIGFFIYGYLWNHKMHNPSCVLNMCINNKQKVRISFKTTCHTKLHSAMDCEESALAT